MSALSSQNASPSSTTFASPAEAIRSLRDLLPVYFRMLQDTSGDESRQGFDATRTSMAEAAKFLMHRNTVTGAVQALEGRQFDAVRDLSCAATAADARGWNQCHQDFRAAAVFLNDAFSVP